MILPLVVYTQRQPQPDFAELQPIFTRLHLLTEKRRVSRDTEIREVEEADSKLYEPISGITIFLEAVSATKESYGIKPRYWLRVEDYSTLDAAAKRAAEYRNGEAYKRIEKVMTVVIDGYISKTSVRIWAVARGKRVYALTTDGSIFADIKLPNSIQAAIEELPETS
jgi:hypothetical protein